MKAWVVGEVGEWRMAWFAETRGQARVRAANAYGVDEPFAAGFSVRRTPLLDAHEAYWREHEDVPAGAWWSAGYMAVCQRCGEPVARDGSCGDPECDRQHGAPVVADPRAYHAECAPAEVPA